jgi:hypothetical protein
MAQPVATEHVNLLGDHAWIITLVKPRRKEPVPEERHLLLERTLGVEQAVDPDGLRPVELKRIFRLNVVPLQDIGLDVRERFRVKQALDGGLVAILYSSLEDVARRPKTCPTKQVRHALQLSKRHHLLLTLAAESSPAGYANADSS